MIVGIEIVSIQHGELLCHAKVNSERHYFSALNLSLCISRVRCYRSAIICIIVLIRIG